MVQVNAGSTDSSGLKSKISISPPGPYQLGTATVKLTISNPLASASCTASITVLVMPALPAASLHCSSLRMSARDAVHVRGCHRPCKLVQRWRVPNYQHISSA